MIQLEGLLEAADNANPPGLGSGDAAPAPVQALEVLNVYARLFETLERARVSWCYWKSSRRAVAALAGTTDLDILVAPAGKHEARRVLLACGFRLFTPVADRADLSVECYLSLDEASGRIAHVDLHTQLVLGGALFKTHRLPWESALIGGAAPRAGAGLPILDPASEAVLLVVRACLELSAFDPVIAWNWSRTVEKFALDRAYLADRVDAEAVRVRASELLDGQCAQLLVEAWTDPRPLHQQHALRHRLRRRLLRYRICGAVEQWVRSAWRAVCAAAGVVNRRGLHWPRPWNRRVAGGGIVVAVVAVDGAGKSTLVRGLRDWLGPEVDVLPLYFGTGDGRPSWFLLPLKLLVPLVSVLLPRKPKGSSHGTVTDSAPGLAYSILLAIWAVVLAAEKRLKLRTAQRAASRGMVVITDRFPQDEIPDFNDGPLLPRLRRVPAWLLAYEASAYALAREWRPDLVIKLVASPELIAAREPTMDPGVVRERVAGVEKLRFGGAPITSICAARPAADVLRAAKHEIWDAL
jgi:hypothetical protein